jgi:hypothetical protein
MPVLDGWADICAGQMIFGQHALKGIDHVRAAVRRLKVRLDDNVAPDLSETGYSR